MRYLDDVLMVAGLVAVTYGVSLLSIPLAWIVAGVGLIALGVLVGLGGGKC